MQNTAYNLSPSAAKYKNMRLSLLFVVVCTYLNLVFSLLGVYFVFSLHLPTLFCTTGALLYQESGEIVYYVTGVIIAALLAVPYLLCWIFSKKRSGWMIVALILYTLPFTRYKPLKQCLLINTNNAANSTSYSAFISLSL